MRNPLRNTCYLTLTPELFRLYDVQANSWCSEPPVLAYRTGNNQQRIPVAVGHAAQACAEQPGITLVNGFAHPRTLLANFTFAEITMRLLLQKLSAKYALRLPPILILHPQARLEGGLTQIEIRALAEVGHSAGAKQVYVWVGEELPRATLNTLDFSQAQGQLLS